MPGNTNDALGAHQNKILLKRNLIISVRGLKNAKDVMSAASGSILGTLRRAASCGFTHNRFDVR